MAAHLAVRSKDARWTGIDSSEGRDGRPSVPTTHL